MTIQPEPVSPEPVAEPLFPKEIEKIIDQQRKIIAQAEGEILYYQGVIAVQEGRKKVAEELIAEMEKRWDKMRKWKKWPEQEEEAE